MTAPGVDEVWRVGWLDGQRLEAGDLSAQVGREAYTRRIHTSVVHETWGIALGFGIGTEELPGVTVAPGLAYDRLGRELVSGRSILVPPPGPPVDGLAHWVDLVARWASVDDLSSGPDPATCLGASAVFEERPLVRWADAGPVREDDQGNLLRPTRYGAGVRLGLDVPLARFAIQPEGTLDNLDLSSRRMAHGRVRPYIASGIIRQGLAGITGDHRTWSLSVDTSIGGFTTSSVTYFVALGTHPWGGSSGFNSGTMSAHNDAVPVGSARELLTKQLPFGQGPFLEISEPDRVHFVVTVRHALPERLAFGSIDLAMNPVPVHWFGIEWVGGCAPTSNVNYALLVRLWQPIRWGLGTAVPLGDPR